MTVLLTVTLASMVLALVMSLIAWRVAGSVTRAGDGAHRRCCRAAR